MSIAFKILFPFGIHFFTLVAPLSPEVYSGHSVGKFTFILSLFAHLFFSSSNFYCDLHSAKLCVPDSEIQQWVNFQP